MTSVATPTALSHIRLSVSDVKKSKAFYQQLLGSEPAFDFTDQLDSDPSVIDDQARLFGGAGFNLGDQLLGLRPVKDATRFDSSRVGLDHVSFLVASVDELHAAAKRLDELGVEHGEVTDLGDLGMTILSVQDPDDINVELAAQTG